MSDTQKNITCPACGNEMSKIFIADKSINVDICENGCGGIFFDNQELQEFSREYDDISEIEKVLSNKEFTDVDKTKTRICPSCGTPMVKAQANGTKIDTCYNCGGIFLDNKEFEQVRFLFKRKEKVKQISFEGKSEIDIRSFCEEAIRENSGEDTQKINSALRALRRLFF